MHMIYAFAALLVFQFLGEVAVRALHLPLPGPLAGMLLLFAALLLRGNVPAQLVSTSGQLLATATSELAAFMPEQPTNDQLRQARVGRGYRGIESVNDNHF